VNLSERITAFVADAAVRAIIGSRSEHRDEFLRLLVDGTKIIPGLSLPDLFPSSRLAMLVSSVPGKIERRRRGLLDIVDPIILEHQEKRAAGGIDQDEDLLDVLLRLQKDMDSQYPLTTDNIKSVLIVSSLHNRSHLECTDEETFLHVHFVSSTHDRTHRTCLEPAARRRRRR
jgi:hypothetical protein